MNLIELGATLGGFFADGAGPSHDQIDNALRRHSLTAGDPAPGGRTPLGGAPMGKTKRVRQVLTYASDSDPAAGFSFALELVDLLRSSGSFEPALDTYAGEAATQRLTGAFKRLGYSLGRDGSVQPLVLDNLEGTALTTALRGYIARMNLNPDDTELLVGTGKELEEAAARHVLVELTGGYAESGRAGSFPVTLANAYIALGFPPPPTVQLHADPHHAVREALFLLGISINRLRNEVGSGHGRPTASNKTAPLSAAESRLVVRSSALLTALLLDSLEQS